MMAEAFGIAAGVITVIEASAKIISKCKHLIETAHDAPKDLRHILIEISSLKATLESLQYLSSTDCDFSNAVRDLVNVNGAVEGCRGTIEELAAELDSLSISNRGQTAPGKRQMLKGSLEWCLKESKARKLLDKSNQHKSTITLALLNEVARDMKELKRSVGNIQDDISTKERREICTWLEYSNPTGYHNDILKLREEQTCQWILRLREWTDWLTGVHQFIWIRGIPGAGKTVFASYIIERTLSFCSKSRASTVCLYYYCSYRLPGDQTGAFLRWIVSQLSRQLDAIPQEILDLYKQNTQPTLLQLKEALQSLLPRIKALYVILDGIDECSNRSDLLKLITDLMANPAFARMQLFATSRDYTDIEDALRHLSKPIFMSNPLVDEDIRLYVDTELRTNKKFKWSEALITEVVEALVQGSKGMFRWAACQLYILQNEITPTRIRKALRELPEDLDETYERILLNIPKAKWAMARTALLWICNHAEFPFEMDIPVDCLVSACLPDTDSIRQLNSSHRTTLQDICGCLIRISSFDFFRAHELHCEGCDADTSGGNFDVVSLAHYTVREFLYSSRIMDSKANYFAMSETGPRREFLKANLKICAGLDLEAPPRANVNTIEFYCREVSRLARGLWEGLIVVDEEIWTLQLKTLYSPWHYRDFCGICINYLPSDSWRHPIFIWKRSPDLHAAWDALIYLRLWNEGRHVMAGKFLESRDAETLISTQLEVTFDSRYGHLGIIVEQVNCYLLEALMLIFPYKKFNIFSQITACLNPTVFFLSCVSSHFETMGSDGTMEREKCMHHDCIPGSDGCCIRAFLENGTDPNPLHVPITPLQIAVHNWDLNATKLLLEKGAYVNALGNTTAKILPHIDSSWASSSPLHIIRNAEYGFERLEEILDTKDYRFSYCRPKIEELLIKYGAEDFIIDEIGTRKVKGGTERVLRRGSD